MAENSKIEWCDHTFNPWIGCTKVGPGCDNCYAHALATVRLGVAWGQGAERRHTAASTWKQPRTWNRKAAAAGVRYRVFCASLADVFDNEVPAEWRAELFQLIRETPHLDWLLVTKRIGNVSKMAEAVGGLPDNVWLGLTIVNQAEAGRDVPKLLAVDVGIRFLSVEPLLGPIDLTEVSDDSTALDPECWGDCDCDSLYGRDAGCRRNGGDGNLQRKIDWVIVGGESGPRARPMHPDWARSLRSQCSEAGVPLLFKQWGEWAPICEMSEDTIDGAYHPAPPSRPDASRRCKVDQCVLHSDGKRFDGRSMFERPAFEQGSRAMTMMAIGKRAAGRSLDGVQHDGYPKGQAHG